MKNWTTFVLGILVIIVPLLGVPYSAKTVILVILGLGIALSSLARFPNRISGPQENGG